MVVEAAKLPDNVLEAGLEKTRFFYKNPAQWFFFVFLDFFYIFAQKREFLGFFVSRLLLGASRL
jgi:hypothetical protein